MKKFCDFLRKHTKYITDFEKKKNTAVNKKKDKNHIEMQKYVIFAEEKSKTFAKDKNYQKVRVYCHYTGK